MKTHSGPTLGNLKAGAIQWPKALTFLGLLVVLAGTVVWIFLPTSAPDKNRLSKLLTQAVQEQTLLGQQFLQSDLDALPTYKLALQSYHRAVILQESDNYTPAIPHAESSIALFENTGPALQRHKFNEIKAVIQLQQLEYAGLPADDKRLVDAESEFRLAMAAYQLGEWDTALTRIKRAQGLMETLQ